MKLYQIEHSIANGDLAFDALRLKYDVLDYLGKKRLGRDVFLSSYIPLEAGWYDEGPKSDFPATFGSIIGMTERAAASIAHILPDDSDVLPLDMSKASPPHCISLVLWGVVDSDACELLRGGFPNIEEVRIKAKSLPSLFYLYGYSALLATSEFKDTWESAGLTGMEFREVIVSA